MTGRDEVERAHPSKREAYITAYNEQPEADPSTWFAFCNGHTAGHASRDAEVAEAREQGRREGLEEAEKLLTSTANGEEEDAKRHHKLGNKSTEEYFYSRAEILHELALQLRERGEG